MLVDFFRFPISEADESRIFDLESLDFGSDLWHLEHPSVTHSLIALFDSNTVYRKKQVSDISKAAVSGKWSFAYLPQIEGDVGEAQIETAASMGCKAVVFHPYLQKITESELPRIQELARYAETMGLFVCVCAAYGSKDIYRFQPLKAVVAVAEAVECPVIIVHGGGAKILEAFLIAEAFPNIYLDTSFSLHYWLESPVEQQFAFAIRRLGGERWMFGSDSPFRSLSESIETHYAFFERHGLGSACANLVMGDTAANLLGVST